MKLFVCTFTVVIKSLVKLPSIKIVHDLNEVCKIKTQKMEKRWTVPSLFHLYFLRFQKSAIHAIGEASTQDASPTSTNLRVEAQLSQGWNPWVASLHNLSVSHGVGNPRLKPLENSHGSIRWLLWYRATGCTLTMIQWSMSTMILWQMSCHSTGAGVCGIQWQGHYFANVGFSPPN